MRKTSWMTYIILMGALTWLSFAFAIYQAEGFIAMGLGAIFTTAYLVGTYGYVYEKPIDTPRTWRVLFWINIIGLIFKILSVLLLQTFEGFIELVLTFLFGLPMLIALYKYSNKGFSAWVKQPRVEIA